MTDHIPAALVNLCIKCKHETLLCEFMAEVSVCINNTCYELHVLVKLYCMRDPGAYIGI